MYRYSNSTNSKALDGGILLSFAKFITGERNSLAMPILSKNQEIMGLDLLKIIHRYF